MVDLDILSPVMKEVALALLAIQDVEVSVAVIFDEAAVEILNQIKGIK